MVIWIHSLVLSSCVIGVYSFAVLIWAISVYSFAVFIWAYTMVVYFYSVHRLLYTNFKTSIRFYILLMQHSCLNIHVIIWCSFAVIFSIFIMGMCSIIFVYVINSNLFTVVIITWKISILHYGHLHLYLTSQLQWKNLSMSTYSWTMAPVPASWQSSMAIYP